MRLGNETSVSGVFQKCALCFKVAVLRDRHTIAGHEIKAVTADLIDVGEVDDEASV